MPDAPFRLQWFSTLLPPRTADRVLEVGCGNGQLLELLAARCPRAELVGIDRSELQVRRAAARLASLSPAPAVHHLALDAAVHRFATAPFRCVLAMNVNLVWTRPAQAGAALRQLLVPRGRVLLGFEPPSRRGRAALRARVLRALPDAGLEVHDEFQPDQSGSGAFALALSVQNMRPKKVPA
jgi:SAM-dependent methyltransferase